MIPDVRRVKEHRYASEPSKFRPRWVYFGHWGDLSQVKIGVTAHPQERVYALRGTLNRGFNMHWHAIGDIDMERDLQGYFYSRRLRFPASRELFDFSDTDPAVEIPRAYELIRSQW